MSKIQRVIAQIRDIAFDSDMWATEKISAIQDILNWNDEPKEKMKQ